jgi:hypothetical protein
VPQTSYEEAWLGYLDGSAVRPMFSVGWAMRCSATDRWLFCETTDANRASGALPLSVVDGWLP